MPGASAHDPGPSSGGTSSRTEPFTPPGLLTEEQGLYHLPRDHAFNGGPTYFTNDYNEWHYFTFLGQDKKTGHAISLFYMILSQGWVTDLDRPLMYSMFAYHDTVTGEFLHTTLAPKGTFESSGSPEPNFGFSYALKDPDGGFDWAYNHAQERWHFHSFTTPESKIEGTQYELDVTGDVKVPGYIGSAYWGLESIGFQKLYNQNPETMYGLTYYHTAPEMEMKGSVTLPDGVHEIEGVAWFEHQWGNFRNTEATRYFWGYARFDNGDTMTWRQYYGNPAGKLTPDVPFDVEAANESWNDPHPEVSRFAFIPKGQAPRYSFGPTFLFTPIKWWTSPETGVNVPWWGEMKTPQGTFYLSPTFPEQESVSANGPIIEGANLIRQGSIDVSLRNSCDGGCEVLRGRRLRHAGRGA